MAVGFVDFLQQVCQAFLVVHGEWDKGKEPKVFDELTEGLGEPSMLLAE